MFPSPTGALANYLDWALATFGYRAGDRLAQAASICFDASVRQLLAPLLVGATVIPWTGTCAATRRRCWPEWNGSA